jgi:hypothetical protein
MPEPVESDAAVHDVARQLLRELREGRRAPARLLGVALSGLVDREEAHQLGLFCVPVAGETERDRSVSRVVDQLRSRFGRDAVRPGRMLEDAED